MVKKNFLFPNFFFEHFDTISFVVLDFLWDVFRVIEIAIKNKSTRQYLVDTVRIIRGISNFAVNVSALLVEVNNKDKLFEISKIFLLMQILSTAKTD